MDWVPIMLQESPSPEEWEYLSIFRERAAEYVATLRSVSRGDLSAHFSRKPGQPYSAQVENLPPIEELKGLYLDFRHLFAEREPCYFYRIANIISRRAGDTVARRFVAFLKTKVRSEFVESGFFKYDDKPIDGEALRDLWFNGKLFHNDAEKRRELDNLTRFLSDDLSKMLLYMTVRDAGTAVYGLYFCTEELTPDNLYVRVTSAFIESDTSMWALK